MSVINESDFCREVFVYKVLRDLYHNNQEINHYSLNKHPVQIVCNFYQVVIRINYGGIQPDRTIHFPINMNYVDSLIQEYEKMDITQFILTHGKDPFDSISLIINAGISEGIDIVQIFEKYKTEIPETNLVLTNKKNKNPLQKIANLLKRIFKIKV